MSFKRYDGASWADISTVKRYDGSNWVECNAMKRWNGSNWVDVWTNIVYLFKNGSGYLGTGSISTYVVNSNHHVNMDANSIQLYVTGAAESDARMEILVPAVDITSKSILVFNGFTKYTQSVNPEFYVGLAPAGTGLPITNPSSLTRYSYVSHHDTTGNYESFEVTLDISGLSGSYMPSAGMYDTIDTYGTVEMLVANIYLK